MPKLTALLALPRSVPVFYYLDAPEAWDGDLVNALMREAAVADDEDPDEVAGWTVDLVFAGHLTALADWRA